MSDLEKNINKPFSLNELKNYFTTVNIQINEKKYEPEIRAFKAEMARPQMLLNGQTKTFEQVTQDTTPKMRTEYEVFYNVSEQAGVRVLEEKAVQKQVWHQRARESKRQIRIVQIDLPRKFQEFSLGDYYKGEDYLVWNSPDNTILESVEGRMYKGQMYHFVLNFSPRVDAYYLAAVLQEVFSAEADFRKVGSNLVFNWDDGRTKIEYIIYANDRCRLHFYDVALGKEKIKAQ